MNSINHEEWIRASIGEIRVAWQDDQVDAGFHSSLLALLSRFEESLTAQKTARLPLFTLPYTCANASGQSHGCSKQVTAAWLSYYLSAHLFDSVEDGGDPTSLLEGFTPSVTANFATSLLVTAQQLLSVPDLSRDHEMALDIRRYFCDKLKKMCSGQHMDLTISNPNLEQAWRIAGQKSAEFFALACLAGARIGTQNPAQLRGFEAYGYHLGSIIQIQDDIRDLKGNLKSRGDLALRKRSLPVAYALQVLPAEQTKLLNDLLENAPSDNQAELAARKMIIESGATVYLLCETERRSQLAQQALGGCCAPSLFSEQLMELIKWTSSAIWA
jgi:hypothetical protein